MARSMAGHATAARLLRLGLSGAIGLALIFAGLWSAAQLPMRPSDLVVELVTTAGPSTTDVLIEGGLYAAALGFLGGMIIGMVYESLRLLEFARRCDRMRMRS